MPAFEAAMLDAEFQLLVMSPPTRQELPTLAPHVQTESTPH